MPLTFVSMKIEIDPHAGFCPGVKKTLDLADKKLKSGNELYSIGELLHNQVELDRLKGLGLLEADKNYLYELRKKNVLIRTHGEPPDTFAQAERNSVNLIDGTCGVVKKLQLFVRELSRLAANNDGQILIFGRPAHPEVEGLMGYSGNTAIIIENEKDIEKIDFSRPAYLLSQTTQNADHLYKLNKIIENRYRAGGNPEKYYFYNTICRFVLKRVNELKEFAANHEIILFVGGAKSSNSRYLCSICISVNPRTYLIAEPAEIQPAWISGIQSVGITGATSTPAWQLDRVARFLDAI